ncbi:MAG TPA: TrkA family potassium uptake protein [Bacillota bacterium]|nr:TrkA family potassium uptake protein [Bacillota bacterium]
MKSYLVVGLGRFGTSVARTLTKLGQEVLAVDIDEERVKYVAPEVTHALQVDATDANALKSLGVRNSQVAVVGIGGDVQANIMTTLLLKEMGVPYVVAKALNKIQGRVLEKVGADRVVYPERDMGKRVAHNLVSANLVDYIELAQGYRIEEIAAPQSFVGKSLKELNLRNKTDLTIIVIKHTDGSLLISPGGDATIQAGDNLVVLGKNADLDRVEQMK